MRIVLAWRSCISWEGALFGRGKRQSYTILVADPKTDYGTARLDAMVETTDGFVLARQDLDLRGASDDTGAETIRCARI